MNSGADEANFARASDSDETRQQVVRDALEHVVGDAYGRILSGLIRRARGDFEVAEDALQDALGEALVQWRERGVPNAPAGWLTTVAQRRLMDATRRRRAQRDATAVLESSFEEAREEPMLDERREFPHEDDRLRLIFTCCHPAIDADVRVALTLNTVLGLPAPEIARAFLIEDRALAQRLTRAKRKIKSARIPYRVPPPELLHERLPDVLRAVYLVFNAGHTKARGTELVDADLAREGIRLARILVELMPTEGEALGLLALMLLMDARRAARTDRAGRFVTLDAQDRTLWDTAEIAEGMALLERAALAGPAGTYVLQAALAAEHSGAPSARATAWPRIVKIYDSLLAVEPSPVVELNRAVAISMARGPACALESMQGLEARLGAYLYFHVARADSLAKLGRSDEARAALERAASLATNEVEQRHIASLIEALDA